MHKTQCNDSLNKVINNALWHGYAAGNLKQQQAAEREEFWPKQVCSWTTPQFVSEDQIEFCKSNTSFSESINIKAEHFNGWALVRNVASRYSIVTLYSDYSDVIVFLYGYLV